MLIKPIFILLQLFFASILFGQKKGNTYLPGNFGTIKYDSVVAYQYIVPSAEAIASGNKLNSYLTQKSVTLNKTQIDTLKNILFNTKTYGAYPANCFKNILGFVFFKTGKITASVSISFECHSLSPSTDIDAMRTESFKDHLYDLGYYDGLSQFGKNSFYRLCDRIGLKIERK